jgi:anaerobic selenocysteine-containing dehydrogenase
MCRLLRGALTHLRDGRLLRIEGEPDDRQNGGPLCPNAQGALGMLYHPDRVKRPRRMVGDWGEGKWERVSCDEAGAQCRLADSDRGRHDSGFDFDLVKWVDDRLRMA